ncbi:hypothetical protein [uncultured Pseudacidovorax sp.]|uniref:hypothetical protein n=1 Tax=uncultured Pseudacidovorax sp. TaxID=679313 RepID=UPI0025E190FA|nr:hypothetical protein [uncultured Pseudacidovorax sp.]
MPSAHQFAILAMQTPPPYRRYAWLVVERLGGEDVTVCESLLTYPTMMSALYAGQQALTLMGPHTD